MMRLFARLLLVPIAAMLAMLTAAFVVVTLGQERVVQALARETASIDRALDLGELLLRLALALFSAKTLLPILLLVIAGEVARIRSAIYYVLGGGIALAVVPFLARLGSSAGGDALTVLWQLFATAGFAGGFVYWLVAGRSAGR